METQYISLNMTPTGVNPCFHISQYDVGRMLGFIVHSGGATVDLDTYTCTIEATRSDGTAITSAVATTDNIGTFEVTPTMSNKADKYRCQLIIVDENSKRIASLPFDMDVCKAAMDENSESIEEDASLYQQYTEAVQGAIAEANADIQAEENARIAAVNAEATARANADTALQNNIDAEATARANAITAEATARQTADNTLQGNINSEASARATNDANLQSQINQIIAPSGEAPRAAEVQNARIGADGVTYDTLGEAIRGQVTDLKSALKLFDIFSVSGYEIGGFTSSGLNSAANNRTRSKGYYPIIGGYQYRAIVKTPEKAVRISISWYTADDYTTPRLDSTPWTYSDTVYGTAPDDAKYARVLIGYRDDTIIDSYNVLTAVLQQVTNAGTGALSMSVHPIVENADLNDYTEPGAYSFTSTPTTNSPKPNFRIPAFLEVWKWTNGVVLQRYTYTTNLGGSYIRIKNVLATWTDWLTLNSKSNYVTTAGTDINTLTDVDVYILGDINTVNAPVIRANSLALVQNYKINNSSLLAQSITYIQKGTTYFRFRNLVNEWSNWEVVHESYLPHSLANGTNFDDLTIEGKYSYGGIRSVNGPGPQNTPFDLHVLKWDNGCIVQRAIYPIIGFEAVRFRDLSGKWLNWQIIGGDYYNIEYTYPAISKYAFKNVKNRAKTDRVMQDIAVYNGTLFDFFEGEMYVNGSDAIPITNGHGNNLMFGTVLHGDFPYLYCPNWIKNNCKIYVNEVTTTSATLVRTISFDTLQGYLNACVDEANNRIYGLLNTSETTYEGIISFIVAALDTGAIISNTPLQYRIPIIQGMKFYDGKIYVSSGDNSAEYPNKIMILDVNGNKLSETSAIHINAEIEGFAIDNGKIYVANQTQIFT